MYVCVSTVFVGMFVCACSVRCCLYSQCSAADLALLSVSGSGQISAHLQNNSPEEKLSSLHVTHFLFLPFYSFVISPARSLTLLSLTQTVSPPSYCTQLSLFSFFFGLCSLTLSVSFYIMLFVEIPCGRAECNKNNRTHTLLTLM